MEALKGRFGTELERKRDRRERERERDNIKK